MGILYTNDDGLVQRYGTIAVENNLAAAVDMDGYEGQLVLDFDFSTVATAGYQAAQAANALIKAGSVIRSIDMVVGTAWVGGTSIALDFEDSAGATTPAAGLAAVATASLLAGTAHQGAGAAIGADIPSANSDVALNVTAVGTFTAGDAKVVVRYTKPRA